MFQVIFSHISSGGSTDIYIPMPAKRTGRSEGKGKTIIAQGQKLMS